MKEEDEFLQEYETSFFTGSRYYDLLTKRGRTSMPTYTKYTHRYPTGMWELEKAYKITQDPKQKNRFVKRPNKILVDKFPKMFGL
ncbi:hypothetical protein [Aquimarina algiphila]|uniref:Uncharacterized protein n=1 Tax=Aquimarina algiphila TaxID=2047982 RepID=A0A554VRM4_9FLAO|nr:hypothetical protein [Aquimarina algiphila]TSE11307.1 hypothetical protein FOF46_01365 [Aquimarina algiphila]